MLRPIFIFSICIAVALVGCNVGPNYTPPVVSIIELPTTAPSVASIATTMPATTQAVKITQSGEPVVRWWETFHDAQLNHLVERAAAENLDLQVSASRIRESRTQLKLAGANLLPTVSGTGNYARIDTGNSFSLGGSGNNNTGTNSSSSNSSSLNNFGGDLFAAGLDATWEIDVFGGNRRNIEAAAADYQAAVEDHRDRMVSLTAEVARDYLMLRGLQQRVRISRDNLKLQQETLDLTRSLRKAGFNSELDVSRANTEVAQTQAQIVPLQTQIVQEEHAIATVLGSEPDTLSGDLSPIAPLPTIPTMVEIGLPTDLLRRRPDIRAAERRIASASARIGVAIADYYPKFSLTGDFGFDSTKFSGLFNWESRYLLLNPSVSWKLFDFGRTADRVAAAREEHKQADLMFRSTILTALRESEDALVGFQNEHAHHDALAAAASSARDSVSLARDQYKQGLIDFLQVLDAQRQLLGAEDALAQSDQEIATNLVALYKALGGGWQVEEADAAAGPSAPALQRSAE